MLVLARKLNESIVIGDTIVIKVVALENGVVKLGIEAPKNVPIIRNELIEEVKASNKAASVGADEHELTTLRKMFSKEKEKNG